VTLTGGVDATTESQNSSKGGLLSIAGMAGLPSLSAAVQDANHSIQTAQTEDHGNPHGRSTRARLPGARSGIHRSGYRRIEAAFERIRTAGVFAGAQAGQYMTALTGIEIALWDLAGKALGLPVYQLLSGKVRDRVRLYCDTGVRGIVPGDERSKERIRQFHEMGFTAAKIDIDNALDPARFDRVNWTASNGEVDHMIAKVAFVRELFPRTSTSPWTCTRATTRAPESGSPRNWSRSSSCGLCGYRHSV
jgi:hypothetical protein